MKAVTNSPDPRFTIAVTTEKQTSALLRLTTCLARHRVRIESLTCTEGEGPDLYRHTVVVRANPESVRRAMKQIGAAVGVFEAECHPDGATVDREVALYKLERTAGDALHELVQASRARVLVAGSDYVVLEKTGSRNEIEELFDRLEPFGVTEFVRSGRVGVRKSVNGAR